MKIIFLDIDGVLLTDFDTVPRALNPDCVANLKEILANSDAVIIISSSWRHSTHAMWELADLFKSNGLPEWDNMTPRFWKDPPRHVEIAASLISQTKQISHILILDDELVKIDAIAECIPHVKFIKTNIVTGLTKEDALAAIKFFAQEP